MSTGTKLSRQNEGHLPEPHRLCRKTKAQPKPRSPFEEKKAPLAGAAGPSRKNGSPAARAKGPRRKKEALLPSPQPFAGKKAPLPAPKALRSTAKEIRRRFLPAADRKTGLPTSLKEDAPVLPGEKMQPAPLMPKEDFDAPWKEVLDRQLSQLVAFFIPAAWEEIDWQRKPVSLNTELRRSRRDAASSDRRADSLFKVFLKDGGEHYVIIHVEVQSTVDPLLAQRMFEYGYRAWDRHKREVSSLVILGDTSPNFRPTGFGWSRWGSDMSYRFPVVKLIDYRDRWEELEASRNIFAVVVMAYLKTQDTRRDPEARLFWKSRLVRRLYERQYGREEIVTLFALIDWMMQLPEDLAIIFEDDLESIEAEHRMPYVTSIERRALKKGRIQLLLAQLEHRFGTLPEWTRELLQKATPDLLDDWAVRMLDASRLEDVFA